MGIFRRLFSKTNREAPGVKLREMALQVTPEQLHIDAPKGKPFAAFMETSMPGACVTLSMIGDGSTSLYFSNGGGMIGGGEHESVRKETLDFLNLSAEFLEHLQPTSDFSLPPLGVTRFLLKTPEGFFSGQAKEAELISGKSPLAPLFLQGQNVITKFREAAQDKARSH